MEIGFEKKDDIVLIKIDGQLETGIELESIISELIKNGDIKLAFDLSSLKYISSSGLRVFLMTAKRIKKSNGHLVLFKMDHAIREIFDLTGFASFIPIVDTQQEAFDNFKLNLS
ncbi:STAS domain-containing protein [bacterium]|nr:STAS domain-containing protein [bacterium]